MAYTLPAYNPRSPHESERLRPSWDTLQRPHYPSMPSPSHHTMASPGLFDPESESSDVSDSSGNDYQTRIHSTYPSSIPPLPPKHILESLDAIEARLRDLQRTEDVNIRKLDQLKAKRARKDERIRQKREAQDIKIKAIIDARARRDERISRRRKMEDAAFERFDQDLEEEETNLRRRQKRLKRGLPVDDTGPGSRISSASMSPPGNPYSNFPPPSKRHQTGPPGQNNSPVPSTSRPSPHSTPGGQSAPGPNPPPYAFLQSSQPPTSAPYGRSPTTTSHSPVTTTGAYQSIHRSYQSSSEPSPYGMNGHPPSPHTSRPPVSTSASILNTVPPPRQPSSSYDTRPPPPPSSSGFATINTPPTSGFASINPRNTGTPPAQPGMPLAKSTDQAGSNGHPRAYAPEGTPNAGGNGTGGKRTPSTTHPYQMSEAFANRHHHCERVDHLNRGVWTSFGPGGTKEMPTGPPQEMYLRCNHDGCRRIDWRTVHGLQCHIVKNHEQPKGTIGSLERALDRYGVPVKEVEAYEREHGEGTGGTMADPKNLKLKTKSRESMEKADGQRKPFTTQPGATAYRTNLAMSLGNSAPPYQDSPASVRSLPYEHTTDPEPEVRNTPVQYDVKPNQPSSKFAAVNGANTTAPLPSPAPVNRPVEPRDVDMKDVPVSPQTQSSSNTPGRDSHTWRMWSERSENVKPPFMAPLTTFKPTSTSALQVPMPAPSQRSTEKESSHHRTPSNPPPATANSPPSKSNPVPPAPKEEHTHPDELSKSVKPSENASAQPATPEKPSTMSAETKKETPTTSVPDKVVAAIQTSTPPDENETIEVREHPKEVEAPKTEIPEPPRPEPKSPETSTRRSSIVGVRRGTSRRSSVAAMKAEKEREKEREEAAAAAAVKAEAEAQAAREKERQEEEKQKKSDIEIEKETDQTEDQNKDKEDESDDPDTITAALPSPASRDKDRDRDKDKDLKTTPRRQANGRFLRKK